MSTHAYTEDQLVEQTAIGLLLGLELVETTFQQTAER